MKFVYSKISVMNCKEVITLENPSFVKDPPVSAYKIVVILFVCPLHHWDMSNRAAVVSDAKVFQFSTFRIL